MTKPTCVGCGGEVDTKDPESIFDEERESWACSYGCERARASWENYIDESGYG